MPLRVVAEEGEVEVTTEVVKIIEAGAEIPEVMIRYGEPRETTDSLTKGRANAVAEAEVALNSSLSDATSISKTRSATKRLSAIFPRTSSWLQKATAQPL